MKIHLSADYQSEIWFYAACSQEGHLTAIELATQFVHESAPITLPQDVLLPQLDETQRLRLLQRQISLLEKHQTFFESHHLLAFMPVDEGMANTLLESEFLTRKIKQLPFLMLDISETFLSLNLGKNNPSIAALNREFKLSLSHFGAGKSSTTAVYDNLFSCIRLDKHFIHALSKRASFLPFMQSIIDNFRPHCDRMIICGVDDEMLLDKVSQLSNVHLQGTLFPVVKSDAFETLIYSEQFLHTP